MLDSIPSEPLVTILLIVAAVLLVGWLFARNYIKVPPNTVAVFTGRGAPKTVRGGARLRIPLVERVDMMSLEPFNVDVKAEDVYTKDGVPVTVTGVGLIKFGSTEEALATAVERFLTSERSSLQKQVQEILAGSLRNIVSQGTVEELNSARDELKDRVTSEAASSFGRIGMVLDVLTIQSITDKNGYLDALGKKRTAEVKAAAEIGEAEADRDAKMRSADARRQGEIAQVQADQAVADARQELDLRRAAIQEEVDAAQARAAQAGPRADAESRRAVELANAETDRQRTAAQIAVEQQRAERAREAAQADTVIPAEAARQAAVLQAQGEREAAIAKAEADAKQRELQGAADAQARTVAAQARRQELSAEASGEEARLRAQAAGQRELAEALRLMDDAAIRVQILPKLIDMLPQLAEKLAAPLSNIDRVVIVDNGGNGGGTDALSRFAGTATGMLPQLFEIAKASGLDIPALLGQSDGTPTSNGTVAHNPLPGNQLDEQPHI